MQPKATLKFPIGEVSLEEKEEEEVKKMLSINGILQHQILNGVFSAQFRDDDLKLRYLYKVVFCLHYFSSILLFFYFHFDYSISSLADLRSNCSSQNKKLWNGLD